MQTMTRRTGALVFTVLLVLTTTAPAAWAVAESAPDARPSRAETSGRDQCPSPPMWTPLLRQHLTIAASVIGIELGELVRSLKEGASIAEVAESHGVAPQQVVAAVAAPMHAEIDALVEAGCLRPEAADRLKRGITARVTAWVEATWSADRETRPGRCPGAAWPQPAPVRTLLATAAEVIGLETRELVRLLVAGASVARVAEAHGVAPAEVITALTSAIHDRIDALVEAGCLRPERAERLKDAATAWATAFVERTWLAGSASGRPTRGG